MAIQAGGAESKTIDLSDMDGAGMLIVTRLSDGAEFNLEGGRLTVGRADKCAVSVSEKGASRIHGCFMRSEKGFVFADSSSNGTTIRFADGSEKTLTAGAAAFLEAPGKLLIGVAEHGVPALEFRFASNREIAAKTFRS